MNTQELYQQYRAKMQKIADIRYASAVLQWDQETYLPPKGGPIRGQQIATLSEISHEMFTASETGDLLSELISRDDLDTFQKRNINLTFDDYTKSKKLPAAFVRKLAEAINKSFHAWISARRENSFSEFRDPLSEIIELKKQEAELLGYVQHPYDALMNDYDKGLTVLETDRLFAALGPELRELLNKIQSVPQVENSFLFQHYPKNDQWSYGLSILRAMHYDFEAGRQDLSEHPFTTNFNSNDVRVTTRVDEQDLANMLWSCIHEGGHALYEQGLPGTEYGLPLGEYCSLSIHESQSRLWENCIGRGLPFWQHHFAGLQNTFPAQLKNISVADFYKGINRVETSLIRTEADELTYHFHVMVRYEIEKLLIEGSIVAKDIPAYWNEHYLKYLDISVPDDRRGCLQDVHWSHGSFGYFATYSLGSLYAAQIYAAISKQTPSLHTDISNGNTESVFEWLKQHIFKFGRYYTSGELCRQATGESLNSRYFLDYARTKFNSIYEI